MEKVEQVDREAAGAFFESNGAPSAFALRIREGHADKDPVLLMLARHRIEATRANDEEIARLKRAIESALAHRYGEWTIILEKALEAHRA